MLRFARLNLSLIALAALPLLGRADSISVVADGKGSWQNAPASLTPGAGKPFWDNTSGDGTAMNVGYFLTGTGGFAGNPNSPNIPLSKLQYWGTSTGAADPTEMFTGGSGGVSAQFEIHVAANAGVNQLWYHDSTGNHELYNPSTNSLGQVVSFDPVGNFDFFLVNPSAGYKFYSDSNNSGTTGDTKGNQHFAVFQSSAGGPLYIGIEDLPFGSSDKDYNDLVFSIQAVPEPASATLLVLGAAGLAFRVRRRRSKS